MFAILYFAVMNIFPQWQIFSFGFTPRYSLDCCRRSLLAVALSHGGMTNGSGPAAVPFLAMPWLPASRPVRRACCYG
jgi:hypothetical protein